MLVVYLKGNYSLLDEGGKETGRLIKEGIFTCKAHIETQEGQLNFVKKSFFSPIKIDRNGREIGEVKSGWDSIQFKLDLGSRIQQYKLCRKSFWKLTFKLTNEYKEELVSIIPQFKWRKMHYDYRIEINPSRPSASNPFVILLAIYGVRKMLERQYAAS
jgi:hypothetical protein